MKYYANDLTVKFFNNQDVAVATESGAYTYKFDCGSEFLKRYYTVEFEKGYQFTIEKVQINISTLQANKVYDGSEFYDVSSKQDKKEKDSLLNQFSKLKEMKNCYWIIDKETNLVMGPMTKSDFDRKCKELHVKAKMRRFHEKEFWDQSGTLK